MKHIILATLSLGCLALFAACEDDSIEDDFERAGEAAEDATENAADNIDDAAERTADGVRDAADEIER